MLKKQHNENFRALSSIVLLLILLVQRVESKDGIDSLFVQHYNDVYNIFREPAFLEKMETNRKERPGPLVLFSGDIISPSAVSSFYRGKQFYPFLEKVGEQYAVPGNHENDFGYNYFKNYIKETSLQTGSKNGMNTNWLISNYVEVPVNKDGQIPQETEVGKTLDDKEQPSLYGLKKFHTIKKGDLNIGLIAIANKGWIGNLHISAEKKPHYQPYLQRALELSEYLKSKENCDLVFMLSHINNPEDREVLEGRSLDFNQDKDPNEIENNVDIIFGGHDHVFYLEKRNNRLLVKSGSDFEFFTSSEITRFKIDEANSREKVLETIESLKKSKKEVADHIFYCGLDCHNWNYLLDVKDESKFKIKKFIFLLEHPTYILKVELDRIEMDGSVEKKKQMELDVLNQIVTNPNLFDFNNKPASDNKNALMELLAPKLFVEKEVEARAVKIETKESPLSNFVADIVRAHIGVDIACTLSVMFKSEIIIPENSYMTWVDWLQIFPYESHHRFDVYDMTADDLQLLLGRTLSDYPNKPASFMVCSGMNYEFKINEEKTYEFGSVKVKSIKGEAVPESTSEDLVSEDRKIKFYKVALTKSFRQFFPTMIFGFKRQHGNQNLKRMVGLIDLLDEKIKNPPSKQPILDTENIDDQPQLETVGKEDKLKTMSQDDFEKLKNNIRQLEKDFEYAQQQIIKYEQLIQNIDEMSSQFDNEDLGLGSELGSLFSPDDEKKDIKAKPEIIALSKKLDEKKNAFTEKLTQVTIEQLSVIQDLNSLSGKEELKQLIAENKKRKKEALKDTSIQGMVRLFLTSANEEFKECLKGKTSLEYLISLDRQLNVPDFKSVNLENLNKKEVVSAEELDLNKFNEKYQSWSANDKRKCRYHSLIEKFKTVENTNQEKPSITVFSANLERRNWVNIIKGKLRKIALI